MHVGPLIEERLRMIDRTGGDWPDKPQDAIQWLLEEAPEYEKRNVNTMVMRILGLNFAAIHTSSSVSIEYPKRT